MISIKGVKTTLSNGREVELFPIGMLAERLGRVSLTIRKWEVTGVIPKSIFRDARGNRLYSKEQIEAIVEEAENCQIGGGKAYALRKFSKNIHERLEVLNKKYAG